MFQLDWLLNLVVGPKLSYKKYPIKLPGNKYRISKTNNEK